MSFSNGPTLVTNGLVLALDAGDRNSYVSGSSTWFDLVGSNNGTLTNGPTFDSGSGGSIVFDGVNDYSSFQPVNLSSTNKITVSFWCKILNYRETPLGGNILFEITTNFNNNTTGATIGFADDSSTLYLNTYPISIALKGNTGYNVSGFNKNLVNNLGWHHWVCIFDKSVTGTNPQETFLYIDGVYQTPTIVPASSFRSNNTNNFGNEQFFIGARSGGSVAPSNAQISNLQIYPRVLAADEVLQNYNAQKSKFGL